MDPEGLWNLWNPATWGVENSAGWSVGDSLNPFHADSAGWAGAAEGARGGSSIVASKLSGGASDTLGLTQSGQYQGAEYDASRALTTASEGLLAASGVGGAIKKLGVKAVGTALVRSQAAGLVENVVADAAVDLGADEGTVDKVRAGVDLARALLPSGSSKRELGSVEGGGAGTAVHKNSLDYVGDTHVYRIRGPDGTTHKIGESAQGMRVRDGASIRGEQQARRLTRETGAAYKSDIRKKFADKASAREYETPVIERFRRRYGEDTLPGNKTNR